MSKCFHVLTRIGLLVLAIQFQAFVLKAEVSQGNPAKQMKVAVWERPPFMFKDKAGSWSGLSIELWEQIAARLGMTYTYQEMPLDQVLQQLKSGQVDLSPAVTLSEELSGSMEFTEPYLYSHGAVVTLHKSLLQTLGSFHGIIFNNKVLIIFFGMIGGMFLFSLLLMAAERKHEKGHFSGTPAKRLGSALWFSAVTMTTVGYGDKTPLSPIGRLITFFWMLAGVLIIALFTGTVASDLTRAEARDEIASFGDLTHFRVGCIKGARMETLLRTMGIPSIAYTTPEEAGLGFRSGQINAFAGDQVSLEYLMNKRAPGRLQLFSLPNSALFYAFAVRSGIPQLREINRELLKISLSPDWRSQAERWTGPLDL
jgi:ABC-type amino acid transport substrate-binding protein